MAKNAGPKKVARSAAVVTAPSASEAATGFSAGVAYVRRPRAPASRIGNSIRNA